MSRNTIRNTRTANKNAIEHFMSNVRKLDDLYHLRTHAKFPLSGTVSICRPGWKSRNGLRKYSISGSTIIPNGAYTFASLKAKFETALGC